MARIRQSRPGSGLVGVATPGHKWEFREISRLKVILPTKETTQKGWRVRRSGPERKSWRRRRRGGTPSSRRSVWPTPVLLPALDFGFGVEGLGFRVETPLASGARVISKEKNHRRRASMITMVKNTSVTKKSSVKNKMARLLLQRCPPMQRSEVERLKAKMEPLST